MQHIRYSRFWFFAVWALIACPITLYAQSFEDLMQQTTQQVGNAIASPHKSDSWMKAGNAASTAEPVAEPSSSISIPMTRINPMQTDHVEDTAAAPDLSRPSAQRNMVSLPPLVQSLMSGTRLSPSFHGIRKAGTALIVSYTFDSLDGFDGMHGESSFRVLSAAERATVTRVMEQEIPMITTIRFEKALSPRNAYLRIAAADLSNYQAEAAHGVWGYANYPHPSGAKMVLHSELCHGVRQECHALQTTVRHELGHVMGLKHPDEAPNPYSGKDTSIMSAYPKYYQTSDRHALAQLYGDRRAFLFNASNLAAPLPGQ